MDLRELDGRAVLGVFLQPEVPEVEYVRGVRRVERRRAPSDLGVRPRLSGPRIVRLDNAGRYRKRSRGGAPGDAALTRRSGVPCPDSAPGWEYRNSSDAELASRARHLTIAEADGRSIEARFARYYLIRPQHSSSVRLPEARRSRDRVTAPE